DDGMIELVSAVKFFSVKNPDTISQCNRDIGQDEFIDQIVLGQDAVDLSASHEPDIFSLLFLEFMDERDYFRVDECHMRIFRNLSLSGEYVVLGTLIWENIPMTGNILIGIISH